jgi:hypothetical protein
MDSQLSFFFHLAHVSFAPCSPTLFAFFLTCDHRQSTMVAELPPSWFRSSGSLVSLRRLMGWQAPGFEHRLKHGVVPLANLAPGDFVFFSAYALAGLVPPLSSFFLMLLEFMGSSCSTFPPTPSHWWQSSSTSARCSWGCGRRCACSVSSS